MVAEFDGPCVAVTLHAPKLRGWLDARARKGYPAPSAIWGHRRDPLVSQVTDDWSGSSGLFAFEVAREMGFEKILLCGVPMTTEGEHFKRPGLKWTAAGAFRRGWEAHMKEITPYARSFGGWTRERLGAPDEAFLRG